MKKPTRISTDWTAYPGPTSCLDFEKILLSLLQSLGCLLIQLLLQARHARLDLTTWTQTRGYRGADDDAQRTLKTSCGKVTGCMIPRSRPYQTPQFYRSAGLT